MKRIAIAAAIVLTAACGSKEEAAPAADSAAAAPAVAPAPAADSAAPMDTTMKHDSAATDTTKK